MDNSSRISIEDALTVFDLPAGFSEQALKDAYKRIVRLVHPDRGGTDEMFNTVIDCYGVLLLDSRARSGSFSHDGLKRDFEHDLERMDALNNRGGTQDFDIQKFNDAFEMTSEQKHGYGDWLKEHSRVDKVDLGGKKISKRAFNDMFDKIVPAPKATGRDIVVRPADLMSASDMMMTELGQDHMDDYSSGGAFDCRVAHGAQRLTSGAGPGFVERGVPESPEKVAEEREAALAQGLSERERMALEEEERRQERLEATRRQRELDMFNRRAGLHASASRMYLEQRPSFR